MRTFLFKLLVGKKEYNYRVPQHALANQRKILLDVWNNQHTNDTGLEKILRLFLIMVHFVFPGIYIREYFGRFGHSYKNLAIEAYVLFKLLLPLLLLFTGLYTYTWTAFLVIYLLAETLTYIASLIFVEDLHRNKRSYRRTMMLLLMNYIEIVLDFALIYAGLNLLTHNVQSVVDYVYFSFVTSTTVGYGDLLPVTTAAKILVTVQTTVFVVFVLLFLNFFSNKVAKDGLDMD